MKTIDELRYPVGRFEFEGEVSERQRRAWIDEIAQAPARLREAVAGATEAQLETRYRPGGWTVRQVVHHLADSHMNSYVRFRLALTEFEPTIKPYDEKLWAELPDARTGPVEPSLVLLAALHNRWVQLLRSLSPVDWVRTFRHPERGVSTLERTLGLYAWHGRHHIAQIAGTRK
jgi:uncharacterized damage-inducible protein DinB